MVDTKSGTKTKIFNTAIRMFAAKGYENVSMNMLASAIGIKTASIYYHYESKEDILDACYNFYIEHRHETRLTPEEYEPIIRHGTEKEILEVLNYTFPDDIVENMIFSLLTIFSRIYADEKAKKIYIDEINTSIEYLTDFFKCGIRVGRFEEFNVSAAALSFFSIRMFTAQSCTIEPESKKNWRNVEVEVFDEFAKILPYKY